MAITESIFPVLSDIHPPTHRANISIPRIDLSLKQAQAIIQRRMDALNPLAYAFIGQNGVHWAAFYCINAGSMTWDWRFRAVFCADAWRPTEESIRLVFHRGSDCQSVQHDMLQMRKKDTVDELRSFQSTVLISAEAQKRFDSEVARAREIERIAQTKLKEAENATALKLATELIGKILNNGPTQHLLA